MADGLTARMSAISDVTDRTVGIAFDADKRRRRVVAQRLGPGLVELVEEKHDSLYSAPCADFNGFRLVALTVPERSGRLRIHRGVKRVHVLEQAGVPQRFHDIF